MRVVVLAVAFVAAHEIGTARVLDVVRGVVHGLEADIVHEIALGGA